MTRERCFADTGTLFSIWNNICDACVGGWYKVVGIEARITWPHELARVEVIFQISLSRPSSGDTWFSYSKQVALEKTASQMSKDRHTKFHKDTKFYRDWIISQHIKFVQNWSVIEKRGTTMTITTITASKTEYFSVFCSEQSTRRQSS